MNLIIIKCSHADILNYVNIFVRTGFHLDGLKVVPDKLDEDKYK